MRAAALPLPLRRTAWHACRKLRSPTSVRPTATGATPPSHSASWPWRRMAARCLPCPTNLRCGPALPPPPPPSSPPSPCACSVSMPHDLQCPHLVPTSLAAPPAVPATACPRLQHPPTPTPTPAGQDVACHERVQQERVAPLHRQAHAAGEHWAEGKQRGRGKCTEVGAQWGPRQAGQAGRVGRGGMQGTGETAGKRSREGRARAAKKAGGRQGRGPARGSPARGGGESTAGWGEWTHQVCAAAAGLPWPLQVVQKLRDLQTVLDPSCPVDTCVCVQVNA